MQQGELTRECLGGAMQPGEEQAGSTHASARSVGVGLNARQQPARRYSWATTRTLGGPVHLLCRLGRTGRHPAHALPPRLPPFAGALGRLTVTVQNTTTAALQPASLPNLWLHKLATHVIAQLVECDDKAARAKARRALMAIFRTCTACRDAVLLCRRALLSVPVPIHLKDWPTVLQRVCTVLRRSRKVWIVFQGPDPESDWTETEPYIIHLLLCVRRKLGGTALEGIKEVGLSVSGHPLRHASTTHTHTRQPLLEGNRCLLAPCGAQGRPGFALLRIPTSLAGPAAVGAGARLAARAVPQRHAPGPFAHGPARLAGLAPHPDPPPQPARARLGASPRPRRRRRPHQAARAAAAGGPARPHLPQRARPLLGGAAGAHQRQRHAPGVPGRRDGLRLVPADLQPA